MMGKEAFFTEARRGFHAALLGSILKTDNYGYPSNADKASNQSVSIARGIIERLGSEAKGARLSGQMSGSKFEEICSEFLKETFLCLKHIRDQLKNISQVEHTRHRSLSGFMLNLLGALTAYTYQDKKPSLHLETAELESLPAIA